MKTRTRVVRGLRLVSTVPGYWKIESDPTILFQYIGKARVGPTGARYSVDRWLTPHGAVVSSLDTAVKLYLANADRERRTT
jgi:hypothetical protein